MIPVSKRMIIAITGASGVIYGIHMLRAMQETPYETHLIISESGCRNIEIETGMNPDEIKQMADYTYSYTDVGAALASGSFITEGMVVVPCTIKTLSGIANCYTDNLIVRAADVTLKEKEEVIARCERDPASHWASKADDDGCRNGSASFATYSLLLSSTQDHRGYHQPYDRENF